MNIQVLRVSGDSNINAVSDAIIEYVLRDSIVYIDCIGIKATYTTVKALIKVTEYLAKGDYRFILRPYYVKVRTKENNVHSALKTAIRWVLIAKEK